MRDQNYDNEFQAARAGLNQGVDRSLAALAAAMRVGVDRLYGLRIGSAATRKSKRRPGMA